MYENRKENVGDFKREMYDSFKSNGILNDLKAHMRSKIFDNLKKRNASTGYGDQGISLRSKIEGKENNLVYKVCISIINDFLKKSELAYSMSVLIPESGLGSQTLTKSELEEVLKLKPDSFKLEEDDDSPVRKPSTSLLQDIVESMRRGQSIRPNLVT